MKHKRIISLLISVILVALAGVGFWRWRNSPKEVNYVTAAVQKGDLTQVVTATGSLSAVVTVQVGSQVSGTIDKLYVDFNTQVKAGQVVARLNQDKFKASVDQTKANLLSAQANVAKQKVAVEDARRTLERNKQLKERGLIAQSDLDSSQTAYDAALAQLEVNKAQVEQAQAAVTQSSVDLNNTVIRSPVDGIVVARNIDVGQTVAASLQAPTLFLIANDLSKMQVDTNVSEGDVGNVWVNQDVTFTVDAYPTRRFRGKVLQVRNAAIMVQNVVTYDAVVGVDNKELLLKPGMTANVEFVVSHKTDVAKIPNAALRFRPPGEAQQTAQVSAPQQSVGGGTGRRGGNAGAGQPSRGREAAANRQRTVYVLRDQQAMPVRVRLGISDGAFTEVVSGELKEGDQVIVAMGTGASSASSSTPTGGRRFFGF
ncbi:MAG: efflux RND transporter periplasmic adaptor subunit [Alphaproteobacteria bacterium]